MQQKDWERVRKTFDKAQKIIGNSTRASDNQVICDAVAAGTKKLEETIKSLEQAV